MEKLKEFFSKNKIVVSVIAVILVIAIVAGIIFIVVNNKEKEEAGLQKEQVEQAINNYMLAFNELNATKMLESIDSKAAYAWSQCAGDVTKFKESYDNTTEENIAEYDADMSSQIEMLKSFYGKYLDYYKVELVELLEYNNVPEVEGLVKAKAITKTIYSYEEKEDTDEGEVYFYIYNGKIVTMEDIATETEPEVEENVPSIEENTTPVEENEVPENAENAN